MKNLYLRRKTYYFRISIPKRLQTFFNDSELYIRSLETKYKNEAIFFRNILYNKFMNIKNDTLIQLSKQDIENIVENFKNTSLADLKSEVSIWRDSTLDKFIDKVQKDYEKRDFRLIKTFMNNFMDHLDELYPIPETLILENKLNLEKILMQNAISMLKDVQKDIDADTNKASKTTLIAPESVSLDETPKTIKTKPKETIRSTFHNYIRFQSQLDNWSKDTYQLANRTAIILDMYFKDKDVKEIYFEHLFDFKDFLYELPANFMNQSIFWAIDGFLSKKSDYKTIYYDSMKDFDFILDNADDMNRLSNKTIKDYIVRVNQYFNFLEKYRIIEKYFEIPTPNIKLNSGREHYSDEEVIRIMNLIKNDSKENYFIVLIAMFTGMRLKEITQLTKKDIQKIDNIYCISVNDEEDKTTKNANSKRFIPIHSKILNFGFLEFVNSKDNKLFKINNKEFSSYFRKNYKNKINENKTLYCLRHSFITKLVNNNDNVEHIAMIVGHAPQFKITLGIYNHIAPLDKLSKVIETIQYE
jgi:integrase